MEERPARADTADGATPDHTMRMPRGRAEQRREKEAPGRTPGTTHHRPLRAATGGRLPAAAAAARGEELATRNSAASEAAVGYNEDEKKRETSIQQVRGCHRKVRGQRQHFREVVIRVCEAHSIRIQPTYGLHLQFWVDTGMNSPVHSPVKARRGRHQE